MLLVAAVLTSTLALAAKCPDLPAQRTGAVISSFDPARLGGLWYEHEFKDVAQIGSRCQTLNASYALGSGVVTMAFAVDYGKVPFTINEVYAPATVSKTNATRIAGFYTKTAQVPGGSLLTLPTVVVDVGAPAAVGGRYTTMTLSTCTVKLGIAVHELVLATRSRARDDARLAAMVATATKQGVDTSDLRQSNWSACPTGAATRAPAVAAPRDASVLLTPLASKAALPPLGLVFVQGAQIETQSYVSLGRAVQNASSDFAIYFAVFAYFGDVPEPLQLGSGMTSSIAALRAAGLPADAPLVVAGHSLGGAMLQDWTDAHGAASAVEAQLLFGATLLRKYRNASYGVPTMMMSGELDGLLRVARQAESVEIYTNRRRGDGGTNFPVVIVPGMSHYQFADNATGAMPALVKAKDLRPDISYAAAHAAVATHVADFLAAHDARAALEGACAASAALAAPLIRALKEEGFAHFDAACDTDATMPSRCRAYPRYPHAAGNGKAQPSTT